MKSRIAVLALIAFVLAPAGWLAAQQQDISGTWVGETSTPDAPEPDKLTMVISKKDGTYSAVISDTLGFASDTECDNMTFEDGELKFTFDISDGYQVQTIYITLKVEGDSMTGYWENDAGEGAEITMQKQK
jgi:hypothetical protein